MSQARCPKCNPPTDADYTNQCLCPPKPARMSHVTECSVANVRAEAAEDGSIYRARIFIRTNLLPHTYTMYMEIGEAMAFRDALSRGIHAALSMTADLNARAVP